VLIRVKVPGYRTEASLADLARALPTLAKALGMGHPAREPEREWAEREFGLEKQTFIRQLADDLARYRAGGFGKGRSQAEWWIKRHIRQSYLHAFVLGKIAAGGYERIALTAQEEKWLKKLRYDEYRYLRGFLDDIDAGRGRMPYKRRMRMYGDAICGPYWAGWALANKSTRRVIRWVYHPEAQHCDTCLELNGREWTAPAFVKWVMQTGILPGQNVQCLSNCRCRLVERFV
jgi:hypothetical protein